MCTQGVNLTQFKLSTYQLIDLAKHLEKSVCQWRDLVSKLDLSELEESLKKAMEQNNASIKSLENVLQTATNLGNGDDAVTITPI